MGRSERMLVFSVPDFRFKPQNYTHTHTQISKVGRNYEQETQMAKRIGKIKTNQKQGRKLKMFYPFISYAMQHHLHQQGVWVWDADLRCLTGNCLGITSSSGRGHRGRNLWVHSLKMGWWSHASQESGEEGGRVRTLILQRQNPNVWTGTKDVEA